MRRYLCLLFLLIAVILVCGCQIKKFTKPTWDVTLRVPLINDKYYVSDLIDSVNFFPAPGNNIVFRTTGTVRSQSVTNVDIGVEQEMTDIPLLANQTVNTTLPLDGLADGQQVAYGLISAGFLSSLFHNTAVSLTTATVTINDLRNANNQPLVITYSSNSGLQQHNLAGYHLGTAGSNSLITGLSVTVSTTSSAAIGTIVGLIDLNLTGSLNFSEFRGRLTDYYLSANDSDTNIKVEYPYGLDQAIVLENANIQLNITNTIGFPAQVYGEFHAVNETNGMEVSIPLLDDNNQPFSIAPAQNDVPTITSIEFSRSVQQLLHIMPDRIEFRNAHFLISSPNGYIGDIGTNDYIRGEYVVNSPFTFTVMPARITPSDSIEIKITSDNQKLIRKNVLHTQMLVGITNRLPLGAGVIMYFSTDPNLDVDNPATYSLVRSAHVYAMSGQPVETMVDLQLTHEELLLFTNPTVYMRMAITFDASNGPVTITASPADYIQVRSIATVQVHVEGE